MPTGSVCSPIPRPGPREARGFTYLGLLLVLAVAGATLAALGSSWSLAVQRERERELRFRGEQIRDAVARYRRAQEPRQWPLTLDDLLVDRRGNPPRHHLRRLYADPYTGRADWVLLPPPPTPAGEPPAGFAGVRSRADAPRLDRRPIGGTTLAAAAAAPAPADAPRVSDWAFVHAESPAPAQPARPARTAPR